MPKRKTRNIEESKNEVVEDSPHDSDSEKSESNESGAEMADDKEEANAAWADSIAKILKTNKPKKKKTLVLSKAKKLTDVKSVKVKSAGFEIETGDGKIKEEIVEEDQQQKQKKPPRKKKKVLPNYRVQPDVLLDKNRERTLAKIATRGVVQLFNAVRMQQNDIKNKMAEAGPLEVRKEKVLKNVDKRAFLDVLMGEKSQPVNANRHVNKADEEKTWNVLRDDFMMGAKLKDWDKEMETEEEERNVEVE